MSRSDNLVPLEFAERGRRKFHLESFEFIDVPPEPEYLIQGILPARGFGVVYGPSGCGKSFLAQYMGQHIAQGSPWGGRSVQQGPVVYIAAEGAAGFRKRIVAYRDHHCMADVGSFYLIADCPDLGSRQCDALAIIECVSDVAPALVIIDTLARAMNGADENSAADMSQFVNNAGTIAAGLGCAVLVVHHCGKDRSKGARGSSVLKAAADVEIFVEGNAQRRTATVTKSKDDEAGHELVFELERVEFEAKGRAVASCLLNVIEDWSKSQHSTPKPRVTGQAAIALKALREAIDDAGEGIPDGARTPDKNGCPVSVWRRDCKKAHLTKTDTPEAMRKAFERAVERLQEIGIIGIFDGWVWIKD